MHPSPWAPGPWAPSPWLTAPQAAAALSVSISTLYRWRTQGLLVAGEDWMRKFPSANSPVLYHLQRVEKRIADLTASPQNAIEKPLALIGSSRPGQERG